MVHKGKSERVFTESEVQAILHDMRSWISPDDGEDGQGEHFRFDVQPFAFAPAFDVEKVVDGTEDCDRN